MAENYLTRSQAERYPHFAQFLRELFEHRLCSNNFATKSMNEERNQVFHEYHKTKNSYEAIKLVYDCIWDIISDSNVEDDESLKTLETAFVSSELAESMKLVKGDKPNTEDALQVFGINFKQEKIDDDVTLWIQEQLKNQLIEKGIVLLSEMGHDVQGNNQELLKAKLNQLPSLISSKLKVAENLKKTMEENDQALKDQYTKYTTTLLESLQIMENLLQKHMIEIQNEQNVSQSESLEVQCDALYLKIKSLHLEILCETYTKETVPALKKISKELEAKTEQTENEIRASRLRLNRYESVGYDFNCIVNEYGKLRETIKQKKWTLEKLQSYSVN